MRIGLIGGSGINKIEGLEIIKEVNISTPYGEPSSSYIIGNFTNNEIIFLLRHGHNHNIPPHKINYRANIYGFKTLGVERIISVSAVGGINKSMPPGTIVIPDQIIDMTGGARPSTFYDSDKVVHIDFTEPFCPELRHSLIETSKTSGIDFSDKGTYICVNGPRLETAKEILFFSQIGADVVGMTAMPEASLARELEICYSLMSVITNYGAGISENKLTTKEVIDTMQNSIEKIRTILRYALPKISLERSCPCKDALKDAEF